MITDIATGCFMPLCYGGGIRNIEKIKKIMTIGVEKISLNTSAIENPKLVNEAAYAFGNQAVINSIDVRKNFWDKYEVVKNRGTKSIGEHPVAFAKRMESEGAGEILLTSVDKEETWRGFDVDIISQVTAAVNIPVIVNGGAGNLSHLEEAVKKGGASAVSLGSMVVFQKKGLGVLINFPKHNELQNILA